MRHTSKPKAQHPASPGSVQIVPGARGAVQVITPDNITIQTDAYEARKQAGEEVPRVFRGRLGVDPETGKEWQ